MELWVNLWVISNVWYLFPVTYPCLLQQWEFKSCQGCLHRPLQHVPVQQTAQRLQTGEINDWGRLLWKRIHITTHRLIVCIQRTRWEMLLFYFSNRLKPVRSSLSPPRVHYARLPLFPRLGFHSRYSWSLSLTRSKPFFVVAKVKHMCNSIKSKWISSNFLNFLKNILLIITAYSQSFTKLHETWKNLILLLEFVVLFWIRSNSRSNWFENIVSVSKSVS